MTSLSVLPCGLRGVSAIGLMNPQAYAAVGINPSEGRRTAMGNPTYQATLRWIGEKVMRVPSGNKMVARPHLKRWRGSCSSDCLVMCAHADGRVRQRSSSASAHQVGGTDRGSRSGLSCEGPWTGGAASFTLAWRATTASLVTLKTVKSWVTVTGPP